MRVIYAIVATVLLAGSAHAQSKPITRYGEEDKPKTAAELEIEQRAEKDYKRSLGSVPDSRAVDPWGSVRSEPAAKPAPAKKKAGTSN